MAKVEIVFGDGPDARDAVQIPLMVGGSEYTDIITTTSEGVTEYEAADYQNVIVIYTDTNIYAAVGDEPVAGIGGAGVFPVKADVPEWRLVSPGAKVAVIVDE